MSEYVKLEILTEIENETATKYYYILSLYMKRRDLIETEWRSELLKGIQKYYRNERLQKYSITTIIWKTLESYYGNSCRDAKRL